MNTQPNPQSRWFALARALTLMWFFLSVFLALLGINEKWQTRHTLRPATISGAAFYNWTPEQLQTVLAQTGLTPETINGTMLMVSLVSLTCFWGVGGLLFWRASNTRMGLYSAYILLATGPSFSNLNLPRGYFVGWASTLENLAAGIIFPSFFISLYIFPNGKFVPRFTRWLAVVPFILFGVVTLNPTNPLFLALGLPVLFGYGLDGVISQIYRYWKVSTPTERQQTKWVVFAFGIFMGGAIIQATFLGPLMGPIGSVSRFWYEFLGYGVFLGQVLIPLAIGISIIRYRLWDIDLVIRKTLQYSLLSGLLAFVYFGGVVVLQSVFTTLTGAESPIALVASTLAIAALFLPLRRRVQNFIDKRFYRQKYDAQKVLAEFAATCRDETDLDKLTTRLVEVMNETMQPENVILWLKDSNAKHVLSAAEGTQRREGKNQ